MGNTRDLSNRINESYSRLSKGQKLLATYIKELADKPISSEDTVKGLIADVEYWIKDSKEIVELAEAAGDGVTADQFNDYLGEYQKLLWMLKSYIA